MKAALISLGSVSSQWTLKEMKNFFDEVVDINLKGLEINLKGKFPEIQYHGKPLEHFDCIYAKGSFRYIDILRGVTAALSSNKCYMPIEAWSFTDAHNKFFTHLQLAKAGLPMPTTYLSATPEAGKAILKTKVNFPVVMKFPSGTHGKGVMFADSYESASSMLDALTALNQPFLIQEYVETGGVDKRAIVIGGKVVASMQRKAVQGEKRANTHAGGKASKVVLDHRAKKIAVEAAKVMGADICAVDLIEGAKGPMILELNLSPGLQGITEATKVNVAKEIAKHLYEKTRELVKGNDGEEAGEILKDLGISKHEGGEFITHLDFRGERILLPKVISKMTEFKENQELSVKAEKGKLKIEEFKL